MNITNATLDNNHDKNHDNNNDRAMTVLLSQTPTIGGVILLLIVLMIRRVYNYYKNTL